MSEDSARLKTENLIELVDQLEHMLLATKQLINAAKDGFVELHVTYEDRYREITQDLVHVSNKMWREQA